MYIGMWGRSWVCMDLREELGMQGSRGGAGYAGI